MTVGRLHEQKGHCYLIQAVSKVRKEFPKVKLLVTGEGEEENNLKKLVKSLDLTNEVIFAGLSSDIEKILPMAELFILPSLWEGLPNALLEAMAAGLPIIATKVGGIPRVIEDGREGILIAPEDIHGLANAIKKLLTDQKLANTLSANAQRKAVDHFSIETYTDKLLDFLETI